MVYNSHAAMSDSMMPPFPGSLGASALEDAPCVVWCLCSEAPMTSLGLIVRVHCVNRVMELISPQPEPDPGPGSFPPRAQPRLCVSLCLGSAPHLAPSLLAMTYVWKGCKPRGSGVGSTLPFPACPPCPVRAWLRCWVSAPRRKKSIPASHKRPLGAGGQGALLGVRPFSPFLHRERITLQEWCPCRGDSSRTISQAGKAKLGSQVSRRSVPNSAFSDSHGPPASEKPEDN